MQSLSMEKLCTNMQIRNNSEAPTDLQYDLTYRFLQLAVYLRFLLFQLPISQNSAQDIPDFMKTFGLQEFFSVPTPSSRTAMNDQFLAFVFFQLIHLVRQLAERYIQGSQIVLFIFPFFPHVYKCQLLFFIQ